MPLGMGRMSTKGSTDENEVISVKPKCIYLRNEKGQVEQHYTDVKNQFTEYLNQKMTAKLMKWLDDDYGK
jgi:hypothetical protein